MDYLHHGIAWAVVKRMVDEEPRVDWDDKYKGKKEKFVLTADSINDAKMMLSMANSKNYGRR